MSYRYPSTTAEEIREQLDDADCYRVPPTEGVVDVPRLRKTFDWVTEQHERFPDGVQSYNECLWLQSAYRHERGCGTAFCFAGKALEDAGAVWKSSTQYVEVSGKIQHAGVAAAELLGLTGMESEYLFAASNDYDDVKLVVEAILMRAGESL